MWTKTFKSSAAAEDDVEEDDVEMTVEGGASEAGIEKMTYPSGAGALYNFYSFS